MITGIFKQILDRATLAGCTRPPWTFRINVALNVSVIRRIRIDDATDRAMIFRDLCFHSTKRIAVTHKHDLAFNVYSDLLQIVVVVWQAVVCVHNRRSYVAARAVAVKEWCDLWM